MSPIRETQFVRPGPRAPAPRTHASVLPKLAHVVTQQSLFATRPSLAGLAHVEARAPAPRAVFVGVGLASNDELSRALPVDALGMLLAAERARRAVHAEGIALLIADAHALCNGIAADLVADRARGYEHVLRGMIARLGWKDVRLLRAAELHAREDYVQLHEHIRRRAPAGAHPYVTREIADIEYFARACDGILKVGWALTARGGCAERDERVFDERFRRWVGPHVGFVYCKAGRALDDRRRKAVPYIERDPSRRICLTREERVGEKLARASSELSLSTVRGVRKHLKAIARSYRELVRPLSGTLEEQVQAMLDDVLARPVHSSTEDT